MAWYHQSGADADIALSSRVRLARNLEGYPFPEKCPDAKRSEIIETVTRALASAELATVDPAALSAEQLCALEEKHEISPAFSKDTRPHALLLDEEKQLAVMICEEDHVRIQAFAAGFALKEAFENACRIDELLDAGVKVAYHEQLGYLTQNPTDLGTAMRASVMLHLPALSLAGKLPGLMRSLSQLGITLRGVYSEGNDAAGALYQISHSVTLGISENEILEKLEGVVKKIIEAERKLRNALKSDSYARLCDRVMRARGILTNAYLLPLSEFMELWSDVRLGAALELLPGIDLAKLTTLLIEAQPATLAIASGVSEDTPESELSVLRASYMRDKL